MIRELLILSVFFIAANVCTADQKIVCYFDNWAYWRTGHGKFTYKDIDSSLCTHIVYAYMGIDDDYRMKLLDPYLMNDLKDLEHFVSKKGKAKALVSIGGSAQSTQFPTLAGDSAYRKKFANSVVDFIKKHNFDGVMIDWSYPGSNGGESEDIVNFAKLIDDFDALFAGTTYTIGVTGPPVKSGIEAGYDIKKFINMVDFIHILTLDLDGPWDKKTGHASPLKAGDDDNSLSGENALKNWHDAGAPKEKLVLCIPFYGRTWSLVDSATEAKIGLDAHGPGPAGPYSKTPGWMNYNEICMKMKENPEHWSIEHNMTAVSVSAVKEKVYISYDDAKTVEAKAKYIKDNGYGGVGIYTITEDDFHGDCGGTRFPLLKGINVGFGRRPDDSHVTEKPDGFKCTKTGYFRDSHDCRTYYQCEKDHMGIMEKSTYLCSHGQAFDENDHKCKDKNSVPGCH